MITVLVVEDTISERELIMNYLRQSGYAAIPAANAKDALQMATEKQPEVIVTDVVMPGMNGYELCRNLKRNPVTKEIRVVVCTSKNQELDRLWGLKQGADVYVTKPFTKEELIRAVRSVSL